MKYTDVMKNFGLTCLTLIFLAFALEIGIRVFFGNNPVWKDPQVAHEITPYGFRPIPNQNKVFTIDKEVSTNSFGFRDTEWLKNRVHNELKILLVGDSFTFGNGVSQNKIFPTLLEDSLKRVNVPNEVFNASAGGWNIDEIVGYVYHQGIKLRPDVCVYSFFKNDYQAGPTVGTRSFGQEGRIEGRPNWLKWLPYKYIYLLKRSALVWLLRDRVGILLSKKDETSMLTDNTINFENFSEQYYTNTRILELMNLCNEIKAKFLLAVIPPINSQHPKKITPEYIDNLRQLVTTNGGIFLNLTHAFFEAKPSFRELYLAPWDNHLSPLGHSIVAQKLTKTIEKMRGNFRSTE